MTASSFTISAVSTSDKRLNGAFSPDAFHDLIRVQWNITSYSFVPTKKGFVYSCLLNIQRDSVNIRLWVDYWMVHITGKLSNVAIFALWYASIVPHDVLLTLIDTHHLHVYLVPDIPVNTIINLLTFDDRPQQSEHYARIAQSNNHLQVTQTNKRRHNKTVYTVSYYQEQRLSVSSQDTISGVALQILTQQVPVYTDVKRIIALCAVNDIPCFPLPIGTGALQNSQSQ